MDQSLEFLLQDESGTAAAAKPCHGSDMGWGQALLGKLVKASLEPRHGENYCRLISVGVEGCICPKSFACYDSPLLK